MPRLDNWRTYSRYSRTFGKVMPYLKGVVSGDKRFQDGSVVHTTAIKMRTDDHAITMSGTHYALGDPWKPNEKPSSETP
jgi:hypothetical protein